LLQPQYEARDDDSENSDAPSTSTLPFEFTLSEAEFRPFVRDLLHRLQALRPPVVPPKPVQPTVSPEGPVVKPDGMHTLGAHSLTRGLLLLCHEPLKINLLCTVHVGVVSSTDAEHSPISPLKSADAAVSQAVQSMSVAASSVADSSTSILCDASYAVNM